MLSFPGDVLSGFRIEKPFQMPGELPLIPDAELKPTFGTGLTSITPAHNIAGLRFSYSYNLSREGCIDASNGTLTQPLALQGINPDDKNFMERI